MIIYGKSGVTFGKELYLADLFKEAGDVKGDGKSLPEKTQQKIRRKEQGGTGKLEGILKVKGEYVSTVEEIDDMYQVGSITERTRDKYIDKLEKILNNPEIDFIEGLIKEIERSIVDLQRYIGIER